MKPLILSTANSEYFAKLMLGRIHDAELVTTTRKRFDGGERYLKIGIPDRDGLLGRNVIVVGSGSKETDDDFNEVCRIGSAAAQYGAKRVTYAMTFSGYSTMERAMKPGEIVSAKIMARILSGLPQGDERNCFFLLDLHTAGLVHYFEGNCMRFELYAEEVLAKAFERLNLKNFMFASADLGRPLWVKTFAKRYGTPMAFVDKDREFGKTKVYEVVGDVNGKVVVIYDDMIRGGGTCIDAANAYLARGAIEVHALTSHLAYDDEAAIERIENSPIKTVTGTNSHPMSQHPLVWRSKKHTVEDVSQLFADAAIKLNGG